ncbi:MAG: hypothetical protein M3Q71_25060 [Chloroflexota bacterium]|nr:hypothetical protein [Chloroflexota bacterium]
MAQARGIALAGVDMTLQGMRSAYPPRCAEVIVELKTEADAGTEELDRPLTVAERGYIVFNTLRGSTTLTVPCRSGVAVPVT